MDGGTECDNNVAYYSLKCLLHNAYLFKKIVGNIQCMMAQYAVCEYCIFYFLF